jgi:hypothetical protein
MDALRVTAFETNYSLEPPSYSKTGAEDSHVAIALGLLD